MPKGDGTGPEGQGSKTGRKAGYCSGSDQPGYANGEIPRQGLAIRTGRGNNQGRGRGKNQKGGRNRRR